MRRLLAALLLIAPGASAQTPAPRFRSGAEVIAIDVTVIDRSGAPVADLTAADFTVTVEGKRRAIQSAQFLRADPAPRARRADESTNTDETSGRLLLIVTDDASLRSSSQAVVTAARGLLDDLGPGDLVGVTHVPEGGGVPFTTDRARVVAELSRVRPAVPRTLRTKTVYLSEALDFDGQQRFQWPAAVARECGAEADSPAYRFCVLDLEQAARATLIDASMRANQTARFLERLMKTLEPSGLPVTIVFISDGMVVARDPGALVGLAEAGAEARASLHVIQPAPPTADMTDSGFPVDPVMDTQLEAEGLEQMAARTRGTFHRVVSTGADTFQRIGREIAGYYLLGIEPAPEDRRNPRRKVDVTVRRPGLTVRARSMFALNRRGAEPASDPAARLKQLLDNPVPFAGVPMRLTARTISAGTNQVRVLIAAEIGEPTDQRIRYHVALVATDREGKVRASNAATTTLAPAREGRQSPSLFTTSLLLDPTDYSLRLAVVGEDGRSGSVHHQLSAALREWPGGWRTSDLIAANVPTGDEFPPFNASSIVGTPGVAVVIEVTHDDAATLDTARVSFEIDGAGAAVTPEPARDPRLVRSFATVLQPGGAGEHRLRANVSGAGAPPIVIERTFTYEPTPTTLKTDARDAAVIRGFIEMLERRHQISPALTTFVSQAKAGQFIDAPEAAARPDGDIAMVTFVGGVKAFLDNKPALARVLLQQTLRTSPDFEGARFYLTLVR